MMGQPSERRLAYFGITAECFAAADPRDQASMLYLTMYEDGMVLDYIGGDVNDPSNYVLFGSEDVVGHTIDWLLDPANHDEDAAEDTWVIKTREDWEGLSQYVKHDFQCLVYSPMPHPSYMCESEVKQICIDMIMAGPGLDILAFVEANKVDDWADVRLEGGAVHFTVPDRRGPIHENKRYDFSISEVTPGIYRFLSGGHWPQLEGPTPQMPPV